MVEHTFFEDATMDALLGDDDDSMDALFKEAITEFEQCRIQLNKITERQHRSIEVSSSTPALINLI